MIAGISGCQSLSYCCLQELEVKCAILGNFRQELVHYRNYSSELLTFSQEQLANVNGYHSNLDGVFIDTSNGSAVPNKSSLDSVNQTIHHMLPSNVKQGWYPF